MEGRLKRMPQNHASIGHGYPIMETSWKIKEFYFLFLWKACFRSIDTPVDLKYELELKAELDQL